MELTAAAVREFLGKDRRTRANLTKVSDDDPLFSSGLIDSFVMADLIGFLEKQLGIRHLNAEPEDLDSVRSIVELAAKQSKR